MEWIESNWSGGARCTWPESWMVQGLRICPSRSRPNSSSLSTSRLCKPLAALFQTHSSALPMRSFNELRHACCGRCLGITLRVELLILREFQVTLRVNFENLSALDHLGQQLRHQGKVDRPLEERHLPELEWNEFRIAPGRVEQEWNSPANKLSGQTEGNTVL